MIKFHSFSEARYEFSITPLVCPFTKPSAMLPEAKKSVLGVPQKNKEKCAGTSAKDVALIIHKWISREISGLVNPVALSPCPEW